MKRSMFALFAAFALVLAAPAVAQDPEVQPYEERTNPDADSIAGESGLTITGTVVEWNPEQLQIETATGVEHIQIVPRTQWNQTLTVGDEVSVDYTRTTQGVMIASQIRTSGALAGETDTVTTTTTSSLTTDGTDADWNDADLDTDVEVEADFDADADLDTGAEFDANADLDADADTTWESDDELPATGSELPLLGLLGLLSLVAAVGLRTIR